MTDTELVFKYLNRYYIDGNPLIYLYCCGHHSTPKIANEKMTKDCYKIFYPGITKETLNYIVFDFLENKKSDYLKGLIQIKPITP